MALTKATVAFQASATNTAGSTATGSWIDLTGAYECLLSALITNGATGPTVACSVIVDVSPDNGTTVYEFARATAGTANSGTFYFNFNLPAGVMYARTRFTGNTGQSVTVQADGEKVTAI